MKKGFSSGLGAPGTVEAGGRAVPVADFASVTGGFAIWLGGGLGMAGGVTVMDTGPDVSAEPV